ncbi:MAG: hypothetical protein ACETWG_10060 [Candidatus Neomarinimicrobiota bacterium]
MKRLYLWSILAILVMVQIGWAQVPQIISYQGVLRNPSTGELYDGNYDLTFRLYDVETSMTTIWSEVHTAVLVDDGIFSVNLGDNTPINLSFDIQYWLEIAVGPTTLAPRTKLTAVPYSLNAGAVTGSNNVFPGSGSVGIGTLSPTSKLTVQGSIEIKGGTSVVAFSDGTTQATAAAGDDHSLNAAEGGPTDVVYVGKVGNVGIGTTSPTARLDVAGDVRANSLTLPATMRYYSIPTVAFTPYPGVNKLFITDTSPMGEMDMNLTAPVNLPHGAIIKELTAYIYDASATEDVAVYLKTSWQHDETPTGLLTLTKSTSAGNDILSSTSVDITVDNQTYNYWIEVVWRSPMDPDQSTIKFRNVLIGYTVTSPLP